MRIKIQKFNLILTLVLAFQLIVPIMFAQPPQKMTYQAVIRDNKKALIVSKPIGLRIQIKQGTPTNPNSVYTEVYNPAPVTNVNGLLSVEIGNGNPTDFNLIDWSNGPFYIWTDADVSGLGGINYTISGYSQLVSVPYALYAKNAGPATLASGNLFVGNASNVATATPKSNIPISGFGAATADVSMGMFKITNLATPTGANDAATKAYVDSKFYGTPSGPTLPSPSGAAGNTFFRTSDNVLFISDGNSWLMVATDGSTPSGATNPSTTLAATGDVFYNTTTGLLNVFNGTTWSAVGSGTVTNVTATGPISVTNGATTPNVTISQANTSTPGYLTSADWNTFNSKENAVNKKTDVTLGGSGSSDIFFPTQNAVKTYVDSKISSSTIPDATTTVKGKLQLAGDFGGTADAPTVLKINGATLGTTTATNGNILIANGTTWDSKAVSGDITINNAGVTTIGTGKVTNAKLDKTNIPISGFGAASTDVAMGTTLAPNKITNLAAPTLGADAVNKKYVDDALAAMIITGVTGNLYQGTTADLTSFYALSWANIILATNKGNSIPATICSLDNTNKYTWVAFPKAWGAQNFFYKYGGGVYPVFDGFEKRIVPLATTGTVDYQLWVFKTYTTPAIPVDLIVNN